MKLFLYDRYTCSKAGMLPFELAIEQIVIEKIAIETAGVTLALDLTAFNCSSNLERTSAPVPAPNSSSAAV